VCDVTDYKRVDELFEKAFSEMTKIDYLINNAGFVKGGELIERDFEDWEKTIEINLNSIVYLTQKVLPKMYENNFGHVVNISSASSTLGVPKLAVYTATKWGVWGFTESMRFEAQKRNKNVKFSSIHPSYIKTGMFEGAKLGFLGNLIVPLVKDHDVIAKGIVEDALKKGKYAVLRPRTLRLSILLRGILPDKLFQQLMKIMGVHNSMSSFKGRGN
jgi:all-trans-retinol dehydrogenase (NAD+)